jgi:class 3 adenylate cyclase
VSEGEGRPKKAGVWENLGTSVVDMQDSGGARSGRRKAKFGLGLGSAASRRRQAKVLRPVSTALAFLVALLAILAIKAFSVLELPEWLASYRFVTLLGALALFFVVQTYARALQLVVFYRRFVHPGLRRLLEVKGEELHRGEKLFRGRKTVIMKIDIAEFTTATYDMPYGMRRLFLDLWFTLIDQVVAHHVFLAKSVGDGSFYCFEDQLPGGSCRVALEAAISIRLEKVHQFDTMFQALLSEKMENSPEFGHHASNYLARFEQRAGYSFWDRQTVVRIALVTGYVDEGLWGLSSQSHYDIQGSLPILATRLEETANDGEIVFDRAFLSELAAQAPDLVDRMVVEPRIVDLKGIGRREAVVLPDDSHFNVSG